MKFSEMQSERHAVEEGLHEHNVTEDELDESAEDLQTVDYLKEQVSGMIERRQFAEVISFCAARLHEYGVEAASDVDCAHPDSALSVAEAVNFAAKILDPHFYSLKPAAIVSAYKLGVYLGYNSSDDTFSLFSKRLGVASFHDPNHEVRDMLMGLDGEVKDWPYEWSGVYRQDQAFQLLNALADFNDSSKAFIDSLAQRTTPGEIDPSIEAYTSTLFNVSDHRSHRYAHQLQDVLTEASKKALNLVLARLKKE